MAGEPFACGRSYPAPGTAVATVTPLDFRFFVQDIALTDAGGQSVPVALDSAPPWQHPDVALVDFEDGAGQCLQGDHGTNAQVHGLVPAGEYRGLTFTVGVPDHMNHGDVFDLPDPLRAPRMQWTWLDGYRFMRAELVEVAGGGLGSLHLGSTGCSGDPGADAVTCLNPNRSTVTLSGFEPSRDVVIADLAAVFAGYNLTTPHECHGAGSACEGMLSALGVSSPAPAVEQRVFSAAPLR